jgi:hypothetical protein
MITFLIGVAVGIIGASVGWFFVYRNNKAKFTAALAVAATKIK